MGFIRFSVAIHFFGIFGYVQKWICYAISSDISGNVNRRVTFKIYMLREAKRIAKEVGADFREK